MHAAVLHALGKPPRFEEFPDPTPGEGEVLIHVSAAALKPVDKQMAAGTHYASPREFPVVCGMDGVGRLEDGTRAFFGGARRPYGAMAERAVVRRVQCFPLPEGLDDVTAAAIANPGVSAWLSLKHSAKLVAGETLLILGATGVTGKLAVQIANILGAGRVVTAGRNQQVLSTLPELGADSTLRLDQPDEELIAAFRREAATKRFDAIIDYLWGHPTETLLKALTGEEFVSGGSEIRLVEVGESAGSTIALPAAVLRSTALTILGTGGMPSWDVLTDAFQQVMNSAARGQLRIETERVPLAGIENAWERDAHARRLVVIP
ncbi:MAG TPA: zinc-binding alcohol dehydrogenase family protein [Terriglobales bacterium]|jgi:NADPH2:quinone reductase|nr:zinc-binding alcohol dehydrogenase family protein [Terriglobales bacterium]